MSDKRHIIFAKPFCQRDIEDIVFFWANNFQRNLDIVPQSWLQFTIIKLTSVDNSNNIAILGQKRFKVTVVYLLPNFSSDFILVIIFFRKIPHFRIKIVIVSRFLYITMSIFTKEICSCEVFLLDEWSSFFLFCLNSHNHSWV